MFEGQRSYTLSETNMTSSLKIGRNPKGNENVSQPSIFRCENISFREGSLFDGCLVTSCFEAVNGGSV